MSTALPLAGCSVLVTRPAHQAGALRAAIEAAGARAVLFPVLAIEPLPGGVAACLARLASADFLIFVSANAVDHLLPGLLSAGGLPAGLELGAVGKPTAARLAEYGCPPSLCPSRQFDSEGLLALEALQGAQVQGRRVLIARGEGGRETLAAVLRERGATVEYIEVYRRACPPVDLAGHPWIAQGEVDAVVVTSAESLRNLRALLGDPPWLRRKPLAVIGERLKQEAEAQGFATVLPAPEMSDAGLFAALVEYWASRREDEKSEAV